MIDGTSFSNFMFTNTNFQIEFSQKWYNLDGLSYKIRTEAKPLKCHPPGNSSKKSWKSKVSTPYCTVFN